MNDRIAAAAVCFAAAIAAAGAPAPAVAANASEPRALTVREAVRLALERAPEVAVAQSAAEAAAAAAQEAASVKRPQVYLNSTPGYSVGLPLSIAGEVPSAFGASVRMTLYDAGRWSENLEAGAQAAGALAALEDARAEVVRRTVAACAKLRADVERASGARRRVDARESMARHEGALFREGRVTALDAERASLEEARARQKLDAVLSDVDLDWHELNRLIGWPAGTPVAVTDDPSEAMPQLPGGDLLAAARARDARLRGLTLEAEALGRSARLLSRPFSPMVNAEARYAFVPTGFGYEKYFSAFKENVVSVGVSLVLPVLTGGRETARAAQARARLSHVEAERRVREEDLAMEVRTAEAAAERSLLETGLARRSVALSREALRQARALLREGRGEANAVEQAELDLVEAGEDASRASREQVVTRLRLLALGGGLLPAFDAEVEPPKPK